MRYTEKEYDDGTFDGTNAIKTVIVKVIRAPSRLVGEVATKLPFFSKKNIESILIAAMLFNLLDVVLNVVRLISLGRFNLFTGKNPIILQIVAFVGLLGIYAWYEISDLSIYKTAESLLPKPEPEFGESEPPSSEQSPSGSITSTPSADSTDNIPPPIAAPEEDTDSFNEKSVLSSGSSALKKPDPSSSSVPKKLTPQQPKIINSAKKDLLNNLADAEEESDELDDSETTMHSPSVTSAAPALVTSSIPIQSANIPKFAEDYTMTVPLDDPIKVIEQVASTQANAEQMLENYSEEEEKSYDDFLAGLNDKQKEMLSFSEATKKRFERSVMEVEDTFSSFSLDSFGGFECLAL